MDGHDGGAGGDLGVGHGHGTDLGYSSHDHAGHDHDGHHGTVSAEAMMVAHSHDHGSVNGGNSFGGGDIDGPDLSHGSVGAWSTGEGQDLSRQRRRQATIDAIEKAKTDPNRRYYGAHIVGHGFADIPKIFAEAAREAGCLRICNTVANFNPVDLTDTQLSDWSRFTPPYSRLRTAAGYYPGAPGTTRVFKQYWQVSDKKRWWVPGDKAKFDRTKSTYMEVSIVTWFYAEVGDYETRVDITVVSLPVLDRWDKVWARRRTPLVAHQLSAEKICHTIFDALKAAKPTEAAAKRRSGIVLKKREEARVAEELRKPRLPQAGQSGADLDGLFGDSDPLPVPLKTKAPGSGTAAPTGATGKTVGTGGVSITPVDGAAAGSSGSAETPAETPSETPAEAAQEAVEAVADTAVAEEAKEPAAPPVVKADAEPDKGPAPVLEAEVKPATGEADTPAIGADKAAAGDEKPALSGKLVQVEVVIPAPRLNKAEQG